MPIPSAPEIAANQGEQPGLATHETIIQRLNRKIGDDYFPAESFENATDWDGIPIIYAKEHPDLAAFEKDPGAELKRIAEKTGRRAEIVGTLTNSRIEKTGSIRLMSDLAIKDDPEVNQLYEAGKLTGSTGFWATAEAGTLKGSVIPNHFLLFEEDEQNQPRDKGVVILNKDNMKAFTNEGRVIAGKNKTRFQELLDGLKSLFDDMTGRMDQSPMAEPVTNAVSVSADTSIEQSMREVQAAFRDARKSVTSSGEVRMYPWIKMTFPDCVIWSNDDDGKMYKTPYMFSDGKYTFGTDVPVIETYTEKPITNKDMTETELASKDAEIASLKEQLQKEQAEKKDLANKIDEIAAASRDAAWKSLKNKLPPGLVHTPEKEAETRELFEKDQYAFTNLILEKKTAEPGKVAGEAFVNKDDPVVKANAIFSSRPVVPGTVH